MSLCFKRYNRYRDEMERAATTAAASAAAPPSVEEETIPEEDIEEIFSDAATAHLAASEESLKKQRKKRKTAAEDQEPVAVPQPPPTPPLLQSDAFSAYKARSTDGGSSIIAATGPRKPLAIVTVRNMVFEGRLSQPISRDVLHQGKRIGFRSNKHRFAAMIVSCDEPSCSLLIFETGCFVITGCRHTKQARFAIDVIASDLRRCNPLLYDSLHVVSMGRNNVVGTISFPARIDTDRLRADEMRRGKYHVDSRPLNDGVILLPGIDKVNALVYPTGHMVITGSRTREILCRAVSIVVPVVEKYYCGAVDTAFSLFDRQRYILDMQRIVDSSASQEAIDAAKEEYIVVMNDGTEGTIEEWHAEVNPKLRIEHVRQSIRQSVQRHTEAEAMRIEYKPPAPLAAIAGAAEPTEARELIVAAEQNEVRQINQQLDVIMHPALSAASTAVGARVVAAASTPERGLLVVPHAFQSLDVRRQASAAAEVAIARDNVMRVAEANRVADLVLSKGAAEVRREEKPKHTQLIPNYIAKHMPQIQ